MCAGVAIQCYGEEKLYRGQQCIDNPQHRLSCRSERQRHWHSAAALAQGAWWLCVQHKSLARAWLRHCSLDSLTLMPLDTGAEQFWRSFMSEVRVQHERTASELGMQLKSGQCQVRSSSAVLVMSPCHTRPKFDGSWCRTRRSLANMY